LGQTGGRCGPEARVHGIADELFSGITVFKGPMSVMSSAEESGNSASKKHFRVLHRVDLIAYGLDKSPLPWCRPGSTTLAALHPNRPEIPDLGNKLIYMRLDGLWGGNLVRAAFGKRPATGLGYGGLAGGKQFGIDDVQAGWLTWCASPWHQCSGALRWRVRCDEFVIEASLVSGGGRLGGTVGWGCE
ncbi:hypothetical protein CI238_12359, partial [Colletotrichum incanum]